MSNLLLEIEKLRVHCANMEVRIACDAETIRLLKHINEIQKGQIIGLQETIDGHFKSTDSYGDR